MVQKPSKFSKQIIAQQLAQSFGQALSETELSNCLQYLQFLEPAAGKLFWQSQDATAGIYIILAGKVRLIDDKDNLIASPEAPESFSELTLFSQENFQPYAARASVKLKLCFLPEACLQALIQEHPSIQDHLYQRAVLWDLLRLCRQNDSFPNAPPGELIKALSLLEQHDLNEGKIPLSLVKNSRLWVLRRGELQHTSGRKLATGSLYFPSEKESGWQVAQPTELHSLSAENWEMALQELPQLAEWVEGDRSEGAEEQRETLTPQNSGQRKPYKKALANLSDSELNNNSGRKKISQAYFPSPQVKASHWWQEVTQRYPFYQQQSASDCGAACLVMLGRYWGKRFSINRLRDIANVDRNGSSLRGLAAAAESIGFSTRPVKATLDKLTQQSLPAIAHWNGKHYIVVYKISRDRVIVADPEIGRRSLSHTQFQAGWTGYALLVQPTALIKEAEASSETLWRFLNY